ncbi:LCP family protein [Streptomyces sp. YIM 98790]|uniref:LCP family protein n=1 Tax=Streptomyces sp. YIM 98790 TaxID=2689077 RepID=UPI0028BDBBDE|nr:LCP family protein [Streptomyces sp. YIM 98790]
MRRTGIPDEDRQPTAPSPHAEDLGWDDSLYHGSADTDQDRVPRQGGRPAQDRMAGGTDDPSTVPLTVPGKGGAGPAPGAGGGEGRAARRRAAAGGSGHRAKRRKRPRWANVLIGIATTLVLLVLGIGAAGWLYIQNLNDNITKDELNLGDNKLEKPKPNAAGQTPLNILLLGSDARDSEENLRLGGARDTAGDPPRADVQLLLHVSADRSNATVISIPRDTLVTIPKCTDPDTGNVYPETPDTQINRSIQHGGPGCTVATWEELTGIPIDHFMMIDFAGVVDMADAVGGVPVCVDANVRDPKSGLELTEGEHTIQGEQALQWLRTRYGFGDGSDTGRTKAQQMYLASMVRELQASAKLTDPGKLNSLAQAATNALTVDTGLGSVTKLYDLAEDLRNVPPKGISLMTLPVLPAPSNPEAWLVPDPGPSEELFALVREDVALDEADRKKKNDSKDGDGGGTESPAPGETPAARPDPRDTIEVSVRNGTDSVSLGPVNGRAAAITEVLAGHGFTRALVDVNGTSQDKTTLTYPDDDPGARANAEEIAEAIGLPGRQIKVSPSAEGIVLIIGSDWREGDSYPVADDNTGGTPEEEATLDTSKAVEGDNDSACMEVNPFYSF